MTRRIYVIASNEGFARFLAAKGAGYASPVAAQAALDLIESPNPDMPRTGMKLWAFDVDDFPTHDGVVPRIRRAEFADAAAAFVWMVAAVVAPALGSLL